MPRLFEHLLKNVAIALVYWGVSHVVWDYFREYGMLPAPIWPAAAVALTAALHYGPRIAPGIYLGSLLANGHSLSAPLHIALGISVMNTAGPVLSAWLLNRSVSAFPPFRKVRDVFLFLLWGVALHAALTASGGIASLWLGGELAGAAVPSAWLRWWVAHAGGLVLFAPPLLLWWERSRPTSHYSVVEYLAIAAIACGGAGVVFFSLGGAHHSYIGLPLLLVIPIAWSAVRLPERETVSLLPVVLLIAIAGTVAGRGPFHLVGNERPLVALGLMGLAFSVTILLLIAMAAERRRDLAEIRRVEQSLRESESYLRQTLESIPGMVFTTRADGFCDYQSQQWADYTGVPVSEHLGDGWNKLLHPDDRPAAFRAWRAAVEGQATYDLEYRVRRADGVYEWFRVIGRPVCDPAGRIVRWFGVAMNIERLKRIEETLLGKSEALQRTNAELEEFAYVASHDLKAPLRAVSNLAFVITEDADGRLDEENRSRLRLLRERVKTMDQLINGLLSYARSGQTGQPPLPVALAPLLANLLEHMEVPADVTVELEEPLPTVIADAIQLRQIFQNLISNAVAHRDQSQGRVWVRARDSGNFWCLEVADDGPGIPESARQSVFRMFSGSGKAGHTGMGLAVVRKLVLANGGRIEIADNVPRGALFQIYWSKG